MTIRHAYMKGCMTALVRFKAAGVTPGVPPQPGVGATAATSMGMAVPKPAVQPTAPMAAQAHKANVLG